MFETSDRPRQPIGRWPWRATITSGHVLIPATTHDANRIIAFNTVFNLLATFTEFEKKYFLFSKNSNACDHNPPTSQTDGQTDNLSWQYHHSTFLWTAAYFMFLLVFTYWANEWWWWWCERTNYICAKRSSHIRTGDGFKVRSWRIEVDSSMHEWLHIKLISDLVS